MSSEKVCSYQDVLNYLNLTKANEMFSLTRPVKDYKKPTEVFLEVLLYAILDVVSGWSFFTILAYQDIRRYFTSLIHLRFVRSKWMTVSNRVFGSLSTSKICRWYGKIRLLLPLSNLIMIERKSWCKNVFEDNFSITVTFPLNGRQRLMSVMIQYEVLQRDRISASSALGAHT